jgi:Tfp pilus assembly protein PilF
LAGLLLLIAVSACGGDTSTTGKSAGQVAAAELNAGLAAQMAGKTTEAGDHYHKVLQHDPHNKYAYYNLGLLDQQAGRIDAAEKNYRSALQYDPNMVEALYNLAIVRTAPSPTEAADLYRKVITLKPDWAAAHLNLGFIYQSMGKTAEADAEWKTAVAQDPSMASRIPNPSPKP